MFVDEIGWLNAIYHLAHVAFVGGTLVPIGGHNLLEPAFAGVPVVYGPYHEEQQVGHELLQQHGLGFVISESTLVRALAEIIATLPQDRRYQEKAARLRARGAEIVAKYVDRIENLTGTEIS
jgi:3-deoxy-D-manno-octulosonic-acid transferase